MIDPDKRKEGEVEGNTGCIYLDVLLICTKYAIPVDNHLDMSPLCLCSPLPWPLLGSLSADASCITFCLPSQTALTALLVSALVCPRLFVMGVLVLKYPSRRPLRERSLKGPACPNAEGMYGMYHMHDMFSTCLISPAVSSVTYFLPSDYLHDSRPSSQCWSNVDHGSARVISMFLRIMGGFTLRK